MNVVLPARAPAARPGRQLPAWASVLAVVAHPDDESFGLGAVIDALAAAGAAVHILCYTRGEASTLNETRADLRRAREQELSQANAETGQDFAGQPPCMIDLCVRVSRDRQRRAARLHASQVSPGTVLWRRLQLQGECEHLRWLVPPVAALPG